MNDINRMEKIIKVCISSDNRTNPIMSTSNFDVILSANINNNLKAFRIVSVQIPFKFYPVNSTNNLIYFMEGASPATATIPIGNYSASTLATAIVTAMNLVSPSLSTYTVTYNNTTDAFTFTISAGTFRFMFGTNSLNSASSIIGFTGDGTLLSTQVSNIAPILSGYPAIYLRSNTLSGHLPAMYVQSNIISSVMAVIPLNVNFNNLILYNDQSDQFYDINVKILNKIDFQITDPSGNIIDLRGSPIYIEIEFKY